MPNGNATPSTSSAFVPSSGRGGQAIESRRFGVEIEVEGIPSASPSAPLRAWLRASSTERARRELRLPTGWKVTSDGSLHDGSEIVSPPLPTSGMQALNGFRAGGAMPGVSEAMLGPVRTALSASLHDVFLLAVAVTVAAAVVALFMRELPLRRTWGPPEQP